MVRSFMYVLLGVSAAIAFGVAGYSRGIIPSPVLEMIDEQPLIFLAKSGEREIYAIPGTIQLKVFDGLDSSVIGEFVNIIFNEPTRFYAGVTLGDCAAQSGMVTYGIMGEALRHEKWDLVGKKVRDVVAVYLCASAIKGEVANLPAITTDSESF